MSLLVMCSPACAYKQGERSCQAASDCGGLHVNAAHTVGGTCMLCENLETSTSKQQLAPAGSRANIQEWWWQEAVLGSSVTESHALRTSGTVITV